LKKICSTYSIPFKRYKKQELIDYMLTCLSSVNQQPTIPLPIDKFPKDYLQKLTVAELKKLAYANSLKPKQRKKRRLGQLFI